MKNEKCLYIQQEFKEDTKDAMSLADYLKKPAERLDEYVLHLKVRDNEQHLTMIIKCSASCLVCGGAFLLLLFVLFVFVVVVVCFCVCVVVCCFCFNYFLCSFV